MNDLCTTCGAYWQCDHQPKPDDWYFIDESGHVSPDIVNKLKARSARGGHIIRTGTLDFDTPGATAWWDELSLFRPDFGP